MQKLSLDHENLLKAITAITKTRIDDFSSFLSALRGNEQTAPNYNRALRIICTSTGPDEFLEVVYNLVETLLAYKNSLAINVNEQAGPAKKAAIHYAAINGNQRLYDLLKQYGADSDLSDSTQTSASTYLARARAQADQRVAQGQSASTNSAPENPVDQGVRQLSQSIFGSTSPLSNIDPAEREQMTAFTSSATQHLLGNIAANQGGASPLQQFLSGQGNPEQQAVFQATMAGASNVLGQLFSPDMMMRLGTANDQQRQQMIRNLTQQMLVQTNAARQRMGLPPEQMPEIRTAENTKVPEGDLSEVHAELVGDLVLVIAEGQNYDLDAFWAAIKTQNYVEAIRAAIRSANENVVELVSKLLEYQTRLGFIVNTRDPATGQTPLHESILLRQSPELYMVMVGHGGDSETIRDHRGKCAADYKRQKFMGAFGAAQGNPLSFINNLGLNTRQEPRPPVFQAPQQPTMPPGSDDDDEHNNATDYFAPPREYGK